MVRTTRAIRSGPPGEAAEEGIVIYTVGFGSPEGRPVPVYDEQGAVIGYRQDAQGREIISRLDEGALQQIAEAGGGRYYRASERGAIADLVDQIGTFQTERFQSELEPEEGRAVPDVPARRGSISHTGRSLDRPPLTVGAKTMVGRIGARMFRPGMLIGPIALALSIVACGPTPAQVNESGHSPYGSGDYAAALDAYENAGSWRPRWENRTTTPVTPCTAWNSMTSRWITMTSPCGTSRDEVRSRGLFNRGNAAYRMESYAEAGRGIHERCFGSTPTISTPNTTWSWP